MENLVNAQQKMEAFDLLLTSPRTLPVEGERVILKKMFQEEFVVNHIVLFFSKNLMGNRWLKKAIIITPTSLVSNWEAEIKKWIGERVKVVALCETTWTDVLSGIDIFTSPGSSLRVMIVSYETFRMHSSKFSQSGCCDLLMMRVTG